MLYVRNNIFIGYGILLCGLQTKREGRSTILSATERYPVIVRRVKCAIYTHCDIIMSDTVHDTTKVTIALYCFCLLHDAERDL